MNLKQQILIYLAIGISSFALVQTSSIANDAEHPLVDSNNRIDVTEESEPLSSSSSQAGPSSTGSAPETTPTATKAPHNYRAGVVRAVEVLKSSFALDLKFDTVKKARKFVKYGHLLPSYVTALEADNQDENKELIEEAKKLMEDPRFKVAEQMSRRTMNKYRPLDRDLYKRPGKQEEASSSRKFSLARYLQSLYLLSSLKGKMDKDAAVKQILEHVYDLKKPPMVESLFQFAVSDTRTNLQQSENEENNKTGCQIEVLHPICDLTNTPKDTAQVPDANELLKLKQLTPSKLKEKLDSVKVEPEVMNAVCVGVIKNFKNISLIHKYEKKGVFNEGQLNDKLKSDPELNFYYQLYDLCTPTRIW